MAKLPDMTPHTAAKHKILKRYLDAWFPILGSSCPEVRYVDGFAGPGRYVDGEKGSPIIAIESALAHVNKGTLAPDTHFRMIFVDENRESVEHLRTEIRNIRAPSTFSIDVRHAAFEAVLRGYLDEIDRGGLKVAPTFAFVDPFGFSGIPLELMRQFMQHPRFELFINIMSGFANRFLTHPSEDIQAHLVETFGTRDVLSAADAQGDRRARLLQLYRRELQGVAEYVGQFQMRNRRDQELYTLFFASRSPRGFRKMKEAMWFVDKVHGNLFSDADPKGIDQFDMFAVDPLWDDMISRFAGRTVTMAEVEDFVIERTDYLPKHARHILTAKESSGMIAVQAIAGHHRRAGTFPRDKVTIVFLD